MVGPREDVPAGGMIPQANLADRLGVPPHRGAPARNRRVGACPAASHRLPLRRADPSGRRRAPRKTAKMCTGAMEKRTDRTCWVSYLVDHAADLSLLAFPAQGTRGLSASSLSGRPAITEVAGQIHAACGSVGLVVGPGLHRLHLNSRFRSKAAIRGARWLKLKRVGACRSGCSRFGTHVRQTLGPLRTERCDTAIAAECPRSSPRFSRRVAGAGARRTPRS
jgi:hypothetical protein